jgi:hypothetical protein
MCGKLVVIPGLPTALPRVEPGIQIFVQTKQKAGFRVPSPIKIDDSPGMTILMFLSERLARVRG